MTVIHFLTLAPWRALRQWLLPLLLLISCASLAQDEPERSSGWQQKQAVSGQRQAVVTASPWASRVAWAVLERGGSALDAAVAAAYGWADYTADMPDDEILRRLLALNLQRSA